MTPDRQAEITISGPVTKNMGAHTTGSVIRSFSACKCVRVVVSISFMVL
jgi:hypothetical protein